jgi:hypothetical protein
VGADAENHHRGLSEGFELDKWKTNAPPGTRLGEDCGISGVYQQGTRAIPLDSQKTIGCYSSFMNREPRGLRFPFSAGAEVILEGSREAIPARATELSLRGCFLEIPTPFNEKQRVQVKILHANEYFEVAAEVIYVRPEGVGLLFGDMKPHFRGVLQAWILAALDNQVKLTHS